MRLLTTISTLLLALSLSTTAATAAELKIEKTHEVECKRKTQNGDTVHMHYRGTLASDGSQFDASYDRGTPLTFKLGTGRVIKGLVLQETKKRGSGRFADFFFCVCADGIKDSSICASARSASLLFPLNTGTVIVVLGRFRAGRRLFLRRSLWVLTV